MAIADLPFLQPSDITYLGAFRVPYNRHGDASQQSPGNSVSHQYGGLAICFNPSSGGLFITAQPAEGFAVAEITIPPNPSTSSNRLDLPQATVIQSFRRADPPMGRALDIPAFNSTPGAGFESFTFNSQQAEVAGMMIYGGDMYFSYMAYYDGGSQQNKSHVRMVGTNLASGDFDALSLVQLPSNIVRNGAGADISQANHHAGHTGLAMANVPVEWRSELGNKPCITGSNGYAVVSRTGSMPSALGFDPTDLNPSTPASTLLYQHGFPSQGSLLTGQAYLNPGDPAYGTYINTWHGPPSPNAWYRATNYDRAFIPIPGTRTVLDWHVGGSRDAWVVYGNGAIIASPQAPHPLGGQSYTDSVMNVNGIPNGNGYYSVLPGASTYTQLSGIGSYERTFRLFDADDWRKTYNGLQAQDVAKPYAEKTLSHPLGHPNTRMAGGGTIDTVNRRIYVCDRQGDYTGVSYFPLIHVYEYVLPTTSGPTMAPNATYRSWRYH